MITTIDRAGRIVIPKEPRKTTGFLPGREIEIVHDGAEIRRAWKPGVSDGRVENQRSLLREVELRFEVRLPLY